MDIYTNMNTRPARHDYVRACEDLVLSLPYEQLEDYRHDQHGRCVFAELMAQCYAEEELYGRL